ncbi:MAG: fibronectin type III domain-containing protein [Alistipes sp.]|nr:fibronectin type III domain-containing protein [Alistipes sp.]
MKKFFSMMAVLAAMFAFVACTEGTDEPQDEPQKGGKLATPELSETHTETSFTISWNAVSGADAYMVNFDGKNYTTAELSYTFENLNAGEYTVRVKATGAGYDDSDNAKIVVTLTGITEADWFSQEVFLAEDAEEGITKYNAVWFTWKGTGVADLQYALFETASLEGATDADIKGALNSISGDQLSNILAYVNSAEGFTSVFSPVDGSTSYTLCTLVEDANGIEFLTKSEITTEQAELTEATKRWIGTYSAQTNQMVDIAAETIAPVDKVTNFTFTVEATPGTADEVDVYGLSELDPELPAYGYVVSEEGVDYLCVWACQAVADLGEGWVAMWVPFCENGNRYTFVTGEFVGYAFAMDATGAIEYIAGNGQLSDNSDFSVVAMDFLAYNTQNGNIGLLGLEDGSDFKDWKYGDMTNIVKTEATAAVANKAAMNLSVNKILPASVVVAM